MTNQSMLLNRIGNSLRYRSAYQASPILARLKTLAGQGKYGHGPRLKEPSRLLEQGISVNFIDLDIQDCWQFWDGLKAQSPKLKTLVESSIFWQKIPQYYFSWRLIESLMAQPETVYIDIASTGKSPYWDIINLLAQTPHLYRQDLVFPPGIHDNQIGGSAADLPLEDSSVDAMTLHCSFEHFEGDADTGFVKEAGRVLKPGGKVSILPLYMGDYPFILNDPAWAINLPADPGIVKHFFPRWGERHGRFYSPETLFSRIVEPAKAAGLKPQVIYFQNITDLNPDCYMHFGLVLEK